MTPLVSAGRVIYDRALQMLFCFDPGWIMENMDGPTG
jgi:hypothetical protein